MTHFTKIEPQLFYSLPLQVKEVKKLDAFLSLLERSQVWKLIPNIPSDSDPGRPPYDKYCLFAAVLYCFAIGKDSLREIETACQVDLRIIYLMKDYRPSFSTIARFITSLEPKLRIIFSTLCKQIFKDCSIDMDTVFLDGTKIEANANKYKFVWKPTTFHARLDEKIRGLLSTLNLNSNLPSESFIPSRVLMKKVKAAAQKKSDEVEGGEKALRKMTQTLTQYLIKVIEYEEKERICGPNRRSYYKTDHDATAMCLKEDYYSGLGSNMHAAYCTQLLVSNGFVVTYYVSQDRTDIRTLQPTLKVFQEMYGKYPKRLGADAGYGNLSNYDFCQKNNIRAFVKYSSWSGESSGRYPAMYEYIGNETIVCLGGREGRPTCLDGRHPTKPEAVFYVVKGCTGCEFMVYCRRFSNNKTGDEKVFEIQPRYCELKQHARDILLSPEGIEMRVNRSCQVEGVFGALKQNMSYTRFRRRLLANATLELALTCLGHNVRKFLRFVEFNKLPRYWRAPANLQTATFKKPSAKRLANRVLKKRMKQPNEVARDSYRKRGCG